LDPPKYEQPQTDPQIALLQQQTQQQNIAALSDTARMDTARLAMLYGQSQLSGMSPDIKSVMTGAAAQKTA
jgi:hypothetical protein